MKETFGQRLSRLRKNMNYTQEDIASKLHVTAQAVSKWENDNSSPDISILVALSDIFNITVDELLGKETNKVKVLSENEIKNINSMILYIKIISSDGDNVSINLPLSIVCACVKAGVALPQISSKVNLASIDFNEIISLIEQGVVGKIVDITSADGDKVEIYVE